MPLIINGVEIENLIVINTATGAQVDIETLKDQLGNILFQKQTAPPWFNYIGIDVNGNYEGSPDYDGVPIAYGIGKGYWNDLSDQIGGISSFVWISAGGLNDEYFNTKYGTDYVKNVTITTSDTIDWNIDLVLPKQVVSDVLIIPDTYNGLPVTTICPKAFMCRDKSLVSSESGTNKYTKYQPSFYKEIVFGSNITTIGLNAFSGLNIGIVELPNTITEFGSSIFGSFANDSSGLRVNSNIIPYSDPTQMVGTLGIFDNISPVIFSSNVTELTSPINSNTSELVWVFEHSADTPFTITPGSRPKTAQTVTIYTDNLSIRNYDWVANVNITPTFYPLSDYTG